MVQQMMMSRWKKGDTEDNLWKFKPYRISKATRVVAGKGKKSLKRAGKKPFWQRVGKRAFWQEGGSVQQNRIYSLVRSILG